MSLQHSDRRRPACGGRRVSGRRGAAAVFVAVCSVLLISMAALAIDLGMLYVARTESQVSADSAAMAAAWLLVNEDRLRGNSAAVFEAARAEAQRVAGLNKVFKVSPYVDPNSGNDPAGDVLIGHLSDPANAGESMDTGEAGLFNSVRVRIRRDDERNGPLRNFFAGLFGHLSSNVLADATATLRDGVVGYRVTDQTGNAELLPFTLQVDYWNNLLSGAHHSGDNFAYDPETGTVSAGHDGINELNLYPGGGSGQLPPGNFGTVDIGPPGNSAADLARQILYGVSAADLAYFGGELRLGADGSLNLNGDTGLSAGVKDELAAIKGLPRAIPLFTTVSGPGNNANFKITAFAGLRIMDVKLTGAMSKKALIVQPAYVVDDAVITDGNSGSSYLVYEPVRLSR